MNERRSLSISAPGLNSTEMKVLQVAVAMLNDEDVDCSIIEGINGDGEIVILDIDTDIGQAMYGELRDYQVKILLANNPSITEKNTISLRKPFRVTTLKDLLLQICGQLLKYIAEHEVNADVASSKTIRNISEESDTAFVRMYQSKKQGVCMVLSIPGSPPVYINGREKTVYAGGGKQTFAEYYESDASVINSKIINGDEFRANVTQLTPHALDAELWHAGIICSRGKLIPGERSDIPVKLSAWPNFSRQGFKLEFFKIAAFLAKQPISLNELSKVTEIQLGIIIDFYNAAYSVDLIESVSDSQPSQGAVRSMSKDRKSLLGKLAEKLRFA